MQKIKSILFLRQTRWILLGAFTLLVKLLFMLSPWLAEHFYARGVFVFIRVLYDYSFGLLPIPTIVWLLPLLLAGYIYARYKGKRIFNSVVSGFKGKLYNLLAVGGIITVLFFWLWGFNYHRMPLEKQLGLVLSNLDSASIVSAFEEATEELVEARERIPSAGSRALGAEFLPNELEAEIRNELELFLQKSGFPVVGRVRVRRLWPEGILAYWGISGIYNVYFGEAYYSTMASTVEFPALIAHEMSHGYGFADEGSCNFLAYLVCERSYFPIVRYSGRLLYWRYLASLIFVQSPEVFKGYLRQLPEGIRADLALSERKAKYSQGGLSKLGRKVNDIYLKSNGVSAGVASYNSMVMYVLAWKQKYGYGSLK